MSRHGILASMSAKYHVQDTEASLGIKIWNDCLQVVGLMRCSCCTLKYALQFSEDAEAMKKRQITEGHFRPPKLRPRTSINGLMEGTAKSFDFFKVLLIVIFRL
jgi:hypothetical protein